MTRHKLLPAILLVVASGLVLSGVVIASTFGTGANSTISGGLGNQATGDYSTASGGRDNTAEGNYSTVGGGLTSQATGVLATVAGGQSNIAGGTRAAIGGGYDNQATGGYSTVSGGRGNTGGGIYSAVGGGLNNQTSGVLATASGGQNNTAGGSRAAIGGGLDNQAAGIYATSSGGRRNSASGAYSNVSGGLDNTAGGSYAGVPGGLNNSAAGDYSLAAGRRAKANHVGTFVWGDSTNADFPSTAADQFLVRAEGGVGIGTNEPKAKLDVNQGSDLEVARFESDEANLVVVDKNGNVGIGTASPGERLHLTDGHFLIEGGGETAVIVKRDATFTGGASGDSVNPIFQLGRIIQAGDGDPEFRFLYQDDNTVERSVFEFDRKGIAASVRENRGSHFEGFISNTDPEPIFRLNSSPKMRLEMGDGGSTPVDVTIQREAANTLAIITGATERIRIDEDGQVGIGTESPNEQLEITENFRLPQTTATTGIIKSSGSRFIHNFGTNNFFAGVNAGNLIMTGVENTGVGENALQANTTGSANTATGAFALQGNTTGNSNTADGRGALLANSTGTANTAVGKHALVFNTAGSGNTAVGALALDSNTTGSNNTAAGNSGLDSNTTGVENTAVGASTLVSNITGNNNTAVGVIALQVNTTGNNNTAIGFGADVSAGDLSNATAVGANAVADANNKIRLGNTDVTVIEGQVAFTFTSDANQKENFQVVDGDQVLEKIRQMTLESWNYKGNDPEQFRHYGPTAQEFFAAFGYDGIGTVGTETTINSGDMAGILMIALQALEMRNAALRERTYDLEARLVAIERLLEVQ